MNTETPGSRTGPAGATRAPTSYFGDVPVFLPEVPEDPYADGADLGEYLRRFDYHRGRVSVDEHIIIPAVKGGGHILAAGEGTGEFVASLAAKYPDLNFVAFDYSAPRSRIATRLLRELALTNVDYYIGSVTDVPFPEGYFSAVIERGVFHILSEDVQRANLAEIERVCRGPVVMNWMTNGRLYLARRWLQAILRRSPHIYRNAIATYRQMEPRRRSLRAMARFIEELTGHPVKVLNTFSGDRELPAGIRARPVLQHLGGLAYRTDA